MIKRKMFIALILLMNLPVWAEGPCPLPPKPDITQGRSAWKSFKLSVPNQFDSQKFTYLISAMDLDKADLERMGDRVVTNRRLLYASLIRQDFKATFGTVGLILGPRSVEAVSHAVPYDTASVPCDQFDCRKASESEINTKLESLRQEHGIYPPESVTGLAHRTWNEVLLSVVGQASKLEIAGIYLMVDARGKALSWSKDEERKANQTAKKLGLPLIRIRRDDPKPGVMFPDTPAAPCPAGQTDTPEVMK